jgi:hypothetical protein
MTTSVHPKSSTPDFPDLSKSSTGQSPQQLMEQLLKFLENLSTWLKAQVKDIDGHGHKTKRNADAGPPSPGDVDDEPVTKHKHKHKHKHSKETPPAPAPSHAGGPGDGPGDVPGGVKPERGQSMPEPTGVVDVDKPIIVKAGQTFDGGGKYYRPTKAIGDGSQNEHQQPLFILEPGATLKNVQYSGGDGIHLLGSANLDHVVNRDIGEDAITIDGEKNRIHDARLSGMSVDDIPKGPAKVSITNSSFYNGSDKVVQDNGDADVLMKDVYVNGAGKVFRTNGGQPITSRLAVEDSTFENVKEALFRTDSKTSSASFSNVDDGDMKVDALTPDAAQISGTGKVSYKPYTG